MLGIRGKLALFLVCVCFLVSVILIGGTRYCCASENIEGEETPSEEDLPRFTMEFRDAEIGDVLRLLALESGLNIIMGDDIKGRVTVSFHDVSLKEALTAILKTYKYSFQVEEGIIIVSTEKDESMVTRSFNMNYATNAAGSNDLDNLAEALRPLLSGKEGSSINVVNRTNTILVTDISENADNILYLASQLDKRTPQVKIEARIIEIKDLYKKELGVQWGADYIADSAHGNATGISFPNSVNIGGTQEGGFLVNMPSTDAMAGIGLQLGHIANTFSLDLRLSAMEKLEKLKILSTPSVLAVQNMEAIIKVGEQLPYQQTTTEDGGDTTTEISFKDVVLLLQVIPYITSDKRIFMNITLNKDTRGEVVVIDDRRDFAIDTKQVSTKVLLEDGETAVIGGLYTQQKSQIDNSVPLLSRIPLLGWLFKSKTTDDSHNELLVFLTARIVGTP